MDPLFREAMTGTLLLVVAGMVGLLAVLGFGYAGCTVVEREGSYRRCVEHHPPEDCRIR